MVNPAVLRLIRFGAMPHRYQSDDEDSGRWIGFPYRDGDIVISTRSKSGTTWAQMVCALLVFQTSILPGRLSTISPWLDWLIEPVSEVIGRLEAQEHRRIIKTHTPLDGLPLHDGARYIVVARRPIDMAVSLFHQGNNLNRDLLGRLAGQEEGTSPDSPRELSDWIDEWMMWDGDPRQRLDSLTGIVHHLSDAWARRAYPNVVLVHYASLSRDLEGEMRRLARFLEIEVPMALWPELVEVATFESMRDNADALAPGAAGVLKSNAAFFRTGPTGRAESVLSPELLNSYERRLAELVTSRFLLEWIESAKVDEGPPGEAREVPWID